MSKTPKSEYTGTWIPAHIMEDTELSSTAKILYAQIASFKTCYATNKFLAQRMSITARAVQQNLQILEDKGYLARSGEEDSRVIVALRDAPRKSLHGGDEKDFVGGGRRILHPIVKLKTKLKILRKILRLFRLMDRA